MEIMNRYGSTRQRRYPLGAAVQRRNDLGIHSASGREARTAPRGNAQPHNTAEAAPRTQVVRLVNYVRATMHFPADVDPADCDWS